LSLLSCGLDDVPFISPIPDWGWSHSVTGTTTIRLPSGGDEGYGEYFRNFIIFYRIYLSTVLEPADIINEPGQRSSINPTLNTDFGHFVRLTDHTDATVSTAGLDTTFINRGFLRLNLEGADVDTVLGRGSLGAAMRIVFAQEFMGQRPRLILNDDRTYYLRRAEHSPRFGEFDPEPSGDLSFLNHPALRHGPNVTEQINADVVNRTGVPEIDIQHSYVLMYMVAEGRGLTTPPTRVFSQPTFLGIFMLPNP